MSCCDISIEEIHKLQSKLERIDEGSTTFKEILKVSEEIDTMLAK